MTFVVNITSNGAFVKRKEGDVHKIISFWVSIEHRAWRKDRRGEWFSRVRRRFNFESREFLI
jgi:hypothetical protein